MWFIKKLLIVTVFTITGVSNFGAFEDKTVDITVQSVFSDQTLTNTVTNTEFGITISLDSSLASISGYSFAYWIVNGVLEESYLSSNIFVVNQEMSLKALFVSNTESVCVFRDINGEVLDYQFVSKGNACAEPSITLPDKPGYTVVESDKWGETLSSITENTIYTLNYQIDLSSSFTLTVTNGSGDGSYLYNSIVTVTADAAAEGYSFSHWEEDGQIVSRNQTDDFGVLANRTIEAIYTDDTVSDAPFVSLTNDLEVRTGYFSYIGRFYVPADFTLIEYGMISNAVSDFDMDTDGTNLHQGFIKMPDTNAFMMSFNKNNYNFVKAYVVLKDFEGDLVTMYSATKGPDEIGSETEYYTTGWEDASKGAYALEDVISNGQTWSFDDAVLGTLATDLKVDSKSIRSRIGYVTSKFAVTDLAEISFQYGTYGSDSDSNLYLEISTDNSSWTTLATLTSTSSLVSYTHILDNSEYSSLGLNSGDSYYIRFRNDDNDKRINIDAITIDTASTTQTDWTLDSQLQSEPISFTLPEKLEDYYTVGEEFTADVCTATDIVDGIVTCNVSGVLDNEAEGLYTLTYSAVSYEGITYTTQREVTLLDEENIDYLTVDYIGYYDGIEGLYGNDLLVALRDIINTNTTMVSYGDARYDLEEVDEDPNIPGNVYLIYNSDSITGIWDGGATWNREHVWPNSRLGVDRVDNTDINIASDLHNLRACNPSVNSSRSNDLFNYTDTATDYYPGDDHRGDVARIMFYMAVMYDTLTLGNTYPGEDDNYLPAGAIMGYLDTLVDWNYLDDVDGFEEGRNEAIYGIQNNRNPFIDYPYLVELVWYDNPNIPS